MHHAAGLRRALPIDRREIVEAVCLGHLDALSAREREILAFATELTQAPAQASQEAVARLRNVGMTDREIHDTVQIVAYFAYANRIALGLGADASHDSSVGEWPSEPDSA